VGESEGEHELLKRRRLVSFCCESVPASITGPSGDKRNTGRTAEENEPTTNATSKDPVIIRDVNPVFGPDGGLRFHILVKEILHGHIECQKLKTLYEKEIPGLFKSREYNFAMYPIED
jgi:hypothetical protein